MSVGAHSDLVERILKGEPRAIGRAMRLVDDETQDGLDVLKTLWPYTGGAWVLGVTGSPGAGKSTLCDRLITAYRDRGHRVGVVAVDPSSPYTGGAILGDRIRMQRHATDDGVFIRSLATRGHLGGLSKSARDVVRVLDAARYGVIIVETVGVGQDEVEITLSAQTTIVVTAPGMGDEVQAIKAGLLEAADVFVVNKADREGADGAVRDLELMISLGDESIRAKSKTRGHGIVEHAVGDGFVPPPPPAAVADGLPRSISDGWTPPIARCVATRGDGVADVIDAADRHRAWVEGTNLGKERVRLRLAKQIRQSLREALIDAAMHDLAPRIEEAIRSMEDRTVDPYTATERLVAAFRTR